MIYTCYDMARDCRAGDARGWAFLIENYLPAIDWLTAHYEPARAGDESFALELLKRLRDPATGLFTTFEPAAERYFLVALRDFLLAGFSDPPPPPAAAPEPELETLTAALEGFTQVEKQSIWFETMRYEEEPAARMLRAAPDSVRRARERGADAIRTNLDRWDRDILRNHGRSLCRAARAAETNDCTQPKAILDLIDGRATWAHRDALERHVTGCWHCIDLFCRYREVVELLRVVHPAPPERVATAKAVFGIETPKPTFWKRVLGR